MSKIFVCYARADRKFAEKLVSDLRSGGVSLWFDQHDILPGDQWDSAVENALMTSPSLLIILSPNSTSSQNVMDELAQALKLNKRIVPVLHRPCDVPFRIGRLQYIDFTTSSYECGIKQLIKIVQPSVPATLISFPTPQNDPRAGSPSVDARGSPKRLIVPLAALAALCAGTWGLAYLSAAPDSFPPNPTRPSWCVEPLNPAERTICDVPTLWPLDNELNERYQAAFSRVGSDDDKQRKLVASEGTWLHRNRDVCGTDAMCLDRSYRNRMQVFAKFK
jgi:hypothetical protein